jgi:hypothetical protein
MLPVGPGARNESKIMSEDKSAGASYLAALKQTIAHATGAAPARAATGKAARAETGHHEKRRSPRYRCQGSAHLREIRGKLATWATFTDISLHGCYVEAMSVFTAGSELALIVEVNGYRVECNGLVRVVYPGLGMGISFTIMSPQNHELLRLLVQSLSQPSAILGALPVATPNSPLAEVSPETANPAEVLQEIKAFFDERQVLGREEFHRILRKHQ